MTKFGDVPATGIVAAGLAPKPVFSQAQTDFGVSVVVPASSTGGALIHSVSIVVVSADVGARLYAMASGPLKILSGGRTEWMFGLTPPGGSVTIGNVRHVQYMNHSGMHNYRLAGMLVSSVVAGTYTIGVYVRNASGSTYTSSTNDYHSLVTWLDA